VWESENLEELKKIKNLIESNGGKAIMRLELSLFVPNSSLIER
jgi:hypothetical protein